MRDPEKRKATYERHKERNAIKQAERFANDRDKYNGASRRSKYRSRYGLHFDEFTTLLERQKGCCAVCGRDDVKLQLDHDHITGKPRAILCFRCNNALGCVSDSTLILVRLIEYVGRHRS